MLVFMYELEKIIYSETYLFQLKNIYQIEGRYIFECILTQERNSWGICQWVDGRFDRRTVAIATSCSIGGPICPSDFNCRIYSERLCRRPSS